MRIVTYNVNGIRAALKNGLADWLAQNPADILCLQEVKATHDVVDLAPLAALGYCWHWHSAEKKGYAGVATFSKVPATEVVMGCGLALYDGEGRVLRTDFGDLTVLNCYFPSGSSGDLRQGVKMGFLAYFQGYIDALKTTRPNLVVVGDYNIAHTEQDIHDPVRNKNQTGFLPEERTWLSNWFGSGFIDAFREKNPALVQYSWWSYRAGARANNKGWRIDYISVAEPLRHRLLAAGHAPEAVHSDHGPVWADLR